MYKVFFCSFFLVLLGCGEYPYSQDPSHVQYARDPTLCDYTIPRRVSTPKVEVPSVCGDWMSLTSKKNYHFECLDATAFQVIDVGKGVPVGLSVQSGDYASISMDIDAEGVQHHLDVTFLLNDAENLIGTFKGSRNRTGLLHFVRR